MRAFGGLTVIALLAIAAGAWPLAAQAPQNRPPPSQEGKIDFDKASQAARVAPTEPAAAGASATLFRQDIEQQARHLQWQRDYERRGWEWHLLSTQLLFGVVIVIVLFGLYITYEQFRRDYSGWEQRPAGGKPGTAPTEPTAIAAPGALAAAPAATVAEMPLPLRAVPGATTLKLSPAGLEVTSQIVGLIVLALSLAFFFLYVKEVYPIREVDVTKQATPPTRDTAADQGGK